jgi:hypothetical protein
VAGVTFGLVPGDPVRNEEMLHAPGVWLIKVAGPPPTQHRSHACPLGPSPYSMFAWRPPLRMLFLLALGRGLPSSSSAPSSSSSSVPAGGPTYTYLMRDGT